VSKLCGVPPATLRAWERRYGVPAPARTASAYRLYGEEDIALITKMRDLVKGGMAAAEAARTVLTTSGTGGTHHEPPEGDDPFVASCDRIVNAAIEFDPDAVEREVSKALALGSAVAIFEGTLGPALRRVGELWHEGTLSVAQEHMASQIIGSTLIHLLRLTQPASSSRRVALACFSDEDHTLGLYGIGLRFTSWGFRTVVLGARTPPDAIGRVVETVDPDLVALSATMTPPASHARELIDAYADACHSTVWIVGGGAAHAMKPWIEARGGLVAPNDMIDVRRVIERSLRTHKRRPRDEELLD
jgi:methanogenic corrinoid protein MtbC1